MVVCENSGHDSSADFAKVSKIVDAGATSKPVLDYELIAGLFRISQTEEKLRKDKVENAKWGQFWKQIFSLVDNICNANYVPRSSYN